MLQIHPQNDDPNQVTPPPAIPGPYPLRKPCAGCEDDSLAGWIEPVDKQNGAEVSCMHCGRHAFWPSRAELGLAPDDRRSLARHGFSLAVETRVFARDGGRCFICQELPTDDNPLQVGHVISRHDALSVHGWGETRANAEDNLMALCRRHNIGLGSRSLDPEKVWAERVRRGLDLLGGQA